MSKKGISPLIGTVLLVAIVIAMILIIMPWVTRTIKDQQTKTAEASRQFDCITVLNFALNLNPSGVMVNNKGDVNIVKLVFRKYDATGGFVIAVTEEGTVDEWDSIVDAYGIETFSSVTCELGERIEAIATIMSEGRPLTCADAAVDIPC